MKKTLISFVGKGQKLKGAEHQAYVKTVYDFGEDIKYETSCFANAIRSSGKYNFDEVIFIGTDTSAWSTLLEEDPNSNELWLKILENEEEEKPIYEYEKELEDALTKLWQKKVKLCINNSEIRADNSKEILNKYIGCLLDAEENVLLDITHGYRWMPILLTSVLQIANSYRGDNSSSIEIIYGEFKRDEDSPVRYLDILLEGKKISDAVSLFFQKYEAGPLVELLTPYWPSGAKAIKKFAINIQGNYFLPLLVDLANPGFQLGQPMSQLKNAIADFNEEGQPAWVVSVHKKLKQMTKSLMVSSAPERFVNLSQVLVQSHYYGQAVIAIALAAEQILIEAMEFTKHPGYDTTKDLQKIFSKVVKKIEDEKSYTKLYYHIKSLRNGIAHGGMSTEKDKNPHLQAEALSSQYERILREYKELYNFFKTEFSYYLDKKLTASPELAKELQDKRAQVK